MATALPASRTEVAIVGGGIGGLALALALAQRDIGCVVVEQHARLRPSAAGTMLQPNGLQALEALGVLPAVLQRAQPIARARVLTAAGVPLLDLDYEGLPKSYPRAAATVPSDVQEVLLAQLGHHAGVEVRWGTVFARLVGENGRVTGILVQDGRLQSIISAGVVVGADGAASAVRAGLGVAADLSRYAEVHFQMLGGALPALDAEWHQYLGNAWTAAFAPLPGDQSCLAVALHERDARRLRGLTFEAFRSELIRLLPAAAPALRRLSSWQEVVVSVPQRIDAAPWVASGAALLGDAAHALSPHVRQGASLALADALVLAEVIGAAREAGDFSARRLAPYERARRPQTALLQGEGERAARTAMTRNPLLRWWRRRVVRALGQDATRLRAHLEVVAGIAEAASMQERLRNLVPR